MKPATATVLSLSLFALAGFGVRPLAAQVADPTGTWVNDDGKGIIQIADCGVLSKLPPTNDLCGVVVWLKDPLDPATGKPPVDHNNVDPAKRNRPILGLEVVIGMKPSRTAGRWDGRVYSIDDGKAFDGSLIVKSATQMRVQGCLLLICQGEEWTRQAVPDAPKATTRPATGRPPSAAQPRAR